MAELFTKVHDVLPIFKIESRHSMILYTPGYLMTLKDLPKDELITLLKDPLTARNISTQNSIATLIIRAQKALENWDMQKQAPFSPECLTVHVGIDCNLDCSYCFSRLDKVENGKLRGFPDLNTIKAIVQQMAEKHVTNSKRLTVVFHGSGEPTLHWEQLVNVHKVISETARQNGLDIFFYISTNGYLEASQIDWLSENMDLIGISCDGPPIIQNKLRTQSKEDFPYLENICERILQNGGSFDIRATITLDTYSKQLDIVRYFIDQCNAVNIRFEPVYLSGLHGFTENHAEKFLQHFLIAQEYAADNGAFLNYAGVRLQEQHGTYCEVLRNTLRLTPDGHFRNCFCFMGDSAANKIGRYNKTESSLEIIPEIDQLKIKASQIPEVCKKCINVFHCSRGCPDFCIYDVEHTDNEKPDPFRCRLHQLLTVDWIKKKSMFLSAYDG